ncbi:pyruvate, phosphate dikinase, chloroplastic-like [Malania oleifera]|uniref:pyruvate, phosphate dikinase, chloroplastic-like n=1 Tax=Malania oleifera TaxID=397392 RepID=UPI0025AE0CBD|nr:pyruvate, phosphate dikinase, chloroplastic-like [Malania oleifera]
MFEDPSAYKDKVVATGLPASPGAAVGQIVFRADDAEAWHAQGKSVILVVVVGDKVIEEGEWLSLNGSTGEVILGKQHLSPPALSGDLEIFMSGADKIRRRKVMANADTPEDALTARNNGAQGIGLCRTEHMFFASNERIKAVRKMIMAVEK